MAIEEHVIFVDKYKYWPTLIEYYYDHIHWDTSPTKSIYEWLDQEYGALTNLESEFIFFREQKRANWFHMRWNPSSLLTHWQ